MINSSLFMLTTIWGYIHVVFYIGLGGWVFLKSNSVSAHLGYTLNTFGHIEFKATYGGFMFSFGLMLMYFLYLKDYKSLLVVLGLSYLGFFSGRLIAALMNSQYEKQILIYLGVELVGLCLTAILLKCVTSLPDY